MKELLETLNEWLSWFENPSETLPSALIEENAVIGLNARGFNSNRFICRFKTEKMNFDVELLMNDKSGEEDAAAMVKLALVALNTPFEEKVEVIVSDRLANYNGGTLKDFLNLIDRINYSKSKSEEIILP